MTTSLKRFAGFLFFVLFLHSGWAAPVFPIKYSANSRYLVDQNNVPFPILGRTSWFITSLSAADYRLFIDDTAARGHTAIELHVLNHDPRGNHPPFNGTGDLPFLTRLNGTAWNGALTYGTINNEAPNMTTPNEPFWSSVDALLAYAESKGILVFMFPAYVGYAGGNQGWMQELVANGSTKVQTYGAWIATRYKNQKNLVWMMGGDMGTSPNTFSAAQTSVENALLTGLKSVAGQQSILFSAEWDSQSIGTDQTSFGSSMTLNGAYSWTGDVNYQGRRAYAYNPVRPAFVLEEPYDQEGSDGNNYNPSAVQPVRRFQWWGWLSTIGGFISGNGYVWPFPSTWKSHLDTQGARDMTRLNGFVHSVAWQNLVPSGLSGMRTLITAGGSSVSAADYVAAAAAPDGTLLVAYIPPAHSGSITVDMAALSGLVRARWFDPTSAVYTDIGTGLANSGTRAFTPSGSNSVGQKDWVLVLDRATASAAPTISDVANQSTLVNTATAAIPFTIGDAQTPAASLTLNKASSNPALVSTNAIVFGGSGSNRTVTITPATGQSGVSTITISVSDGTNSSSDAFVLTVSAAPSITAKSFTNLTSIGIPDHGAGTPYPSVINVSGVGGVATNVTITLRNLTHTWSRDIDVLLVGPGGQKVMLMSDAGNGAVKNVTLTLADAATVALPTTALATGTFRPANYTDSSAGGDNFPSPAPAAPYGSTLSVFAGQPANGTWSLYVYDDGVGDAGSFAGGWSIDLMTTNQGTAPILSLPGPAVITSLTVDAQGIVRVFASGATNLNYALEASSELTNWAQIGLMFNTSGTVAFTEQPTTNSIRFYRIRSVSQ